MSSWIPPALSSVLGRNAADLDAPAIRRLVGYAENDVLEFKSEMPKATDGGRREFACDVAQFANAAGGIIVYGMEESAGRASAVAPVAPDPARPELALWVDQVLAGLVVPHLQVGRTVVDADGGVVLVVSVPPSIASPHAVRVNDALRYVARSGSQRVPLSEHEVAARYRSRLERLSDVRRLGRDLHDEACRQIETGVPETDVCDLWLTVSAVPDQLGDVSMRRGLASEWESQLLQSLFDFPTFGRSGSSNLFLSPRFQALELASRSRYSTSTRARFNLDGSGAISQSIPMTVSGPEADVFLTSPGTVTELTGAVRDDYLVADLVNTVNCLAHHAVRCGGFGDLTVTASLQSGHRHARALALVTARHGSGVQLVHDSVTAPNPTPPRSRSLVLDAVVTDPRSLLDSDRLLAGDLLSQFAIPEPMQFDETGELVLAAFDQGLHGPIEAWCNDRLG